MLSFGGGFASVAAVPGVQIALDLINANPNLLPGYTLHYSLSDSQVFAFCHNYAIVVMASKALLITIV